MPTNVGQCPKCRAANAYTSVSCVECGTRLPWADVAQSVQQSTPQPVAVNAPVPYINASVPTATPATPAPAIAPPVERTNSWLMGCFGVLMVFIVIPTSCSLLFNGGGSSGSSTTVRNPSSRIIAPSIVTPVVTMAQYNQIQDGMSYSQVQQIIGTPGEEEARSHMEGAPGVMDSLTTTSYRWVNSNGSNMSCMFQNDKMVMKAQFGLP